MDESIQKRLAPALDDASRLLLKAAELIEERGWCQRQQEDAKGRLCILGALHYAEGGSPMTPFGAVAYNARNRLMDVLGIWMLGRDWNDKPGRTAAEVIAKLRAVALSG